MLCIPEEKDFWVEVVCADKGYTEIEPLIGGVFLVIDRSESWDYIVYADGDLIEVPIYFCMRATTPDEE